jgi:hypothetical protein
MMWVLLLMAVIVLVLFIERTFYLHRGQIKSTTFVLKTRSPNGVSSRRSRYARRRLVRLPLWSRPR